MSNPNITKDSTNRRKVYLINKDFQISIIVFFLFLSFLVLLIFWGSLYYFFHTFQAEAKMAGLPEGHIFFQFLDQQFSLMNNIFMITSVIVTIATSIGGLVLSHKVAGPLYRLTEHLKTLSSKNLQTVKFRQGDFFIEIQDNFNAFLDRLKNP